MLKKVDHIGIAVQDLEQGKKLFELLTGRPVAHEEVVESEGVKTAFIHVGELKLELLSPLNQTGPIQAHLEKRGPGIQQLAFEVENLEVEMDRLRSAGFILLNDTPKKGANNTLVCFIHPKSAGGILVELCQKL
jgi:methylmalonyl-CoA/ethylmalonyl-CoA epimerase